MVQRTTTVAVITIGVLAATSLAGCRAATPPGAAFTVTGTVVGKKNLEIVSTSFNFTPPVGSPPVPLPGSVTIYQGSGTSWTPTTIVPTSACYFSTRISAPTVGKGSITW